MALRVRPVRATRSERDSGSARVELADDGAQVRSSNGLAAMAQLVPTDEHGFVFLFHECAVRDSYKDAVMSIRISRGGADVGHGSVGDPVDGGHRAAKGHPRHPEGRSLRGRRDLVTGRRGRPFGSGTTPYPDRPWLVRGLLADPDVDAVYIPLPNHLHAEWTIAALRAGKHVLCEKPLAMTADDAQRMVDVARETGVHLMEAFMYRHHPSWVAALDVVDSGRIGTLVAVQSWFSYFNDDPANIRNVVDYGGGALFDIGCYSINLSRMLFHGEPSRVQASLRRDPATGVDVLTSGILDFEDGIATFTCSMRSESDQRVDIYGRKAESRSRSPSTSRPTGPPGSSSRPAGILRSRRTPRSSNSPPPTRTRRKPKHSPQPCWTAVRRPVPPEDAVANLRVIDAIFAAAGSGVR